MGLRAPFALPSFKPLSRSSSPAPPVSSRSTPSSTSSSPTGSPPLPKDRGRVKAGASLPPVVAVAPTIIGAGARPDAEKRSRSLTRPLAALALASASAVTSRSPTPTPSPKLGGSMALPSPSLSAAGNGAPPSPAAGTAEASSHIEAVGLRISEAVTRALVGSASAGEWKGRKALARGSGKDVGSAVVREFPTPPIDLYVLRAIMRTTIKQLSVFSSRLETLVLPALVDTTFSHPILAVPAPPATATTALLGHHSMNGGPAPLNPCQVYALSLAHAAFEARNALGKLLAAGCVSPQFQPTKAAEPWPRFVFEGIQPILVKLDSIIGRVVQPLMATIKRELADTLVGLQGSLPGGAPAPPASAVKAIKGVPGGADVSACLAPFATKIEPARRAMTRIAGGCGDAGEGWIVSVVASTIWKAMLALAERPVSATATGGSTSPKALGRTLTDVGAKLTAASTGGAKQPLTLLGRTSSSIGSRPSSPPRSSTPSMATGYTASGHYHHPSGSSQHHGLPTNGSTPPHDPATHLILGFEHLAHRLVADVVPYTIPARPDPGHLAREALSEALEALQSLRLVFATLGRPADGLLLIRNGLVELKAAQGPEDVQDDDDVFLDALDDVPPVVLFHLFIRRAGGLVRRPEECLGWSRAEYDRAVLAGFGAAEEWERRVGAAVRAEVERVRSKRAAMGDKLGELEERWLEVLGLTVDVI